MPGATPAPTPPATWSRSRSRTASLWDAREIEIGRAMALEALRAPGHGTYALQAAIIAVHARPRTAAETDWAQIAALYDRLLQREPSAVVALNRAVAIAMRDGPEAGIAQISRCSAQPPLATYHLTHAAHADLCRRAGRLAEARASYARALELAEQEPERRFLRRRLAQLGA